MRKFLYIFLGFCLVLFTNCEKSSSSSTTTSSVAKLTSFSFAANDSMPGLAEAVFIIEERNDTGWVYNQDSLRYGTSLEKVVPKFVFQVAVGSAKLQMPDTTLMLTGRDTLDFSKQPIYLTLKSTDGTTTKVYEITVTVHEADPDLFTWTQLTDQVYPVDDSEQRVLELHDTFFMLSDNGFQRHVYTSPDGVSWTPQSDPFGLPIGTKVRQIISDGTTLYYGQDNTIYTSPDGVHWNAHPVSYKVKTMILYWNERTWALVEKNDGAYELATYADGAISLSGLEPDGEFPISDFAAVTFQNASERERAMIIGGFADDGTSLNTRWNIEYSLHPLPNGSYRLTEYSIDRPEFTSLTGISVVSYNDQLMLFGGVDADRTYLGRDILISIDEGLNWIQADTAKNQLPEAYQARQKQTAIVRDNYIYLFGGQDQHATFSDVYRGKLNSIDWD